HRRQIAGRRATKLSEWLASRLRQRLALDRVRRPSPEIEWQSRHRTRALRARQRPESVEYLRLDRDDLHAVRVLRFRQRDRHRHHLSCIEAKIDELKLDRRLDEQSRRHEQREGKRDLGHYERRAESIATE